MGAKEFGFHTKVFISIINLVDQVTVYYGVSFEDRSEQQLCKILFSELLDARKHVQNPPSFALMESEFSKNLVASFPE